MYVSNSISDTTLLVSFSDLKNLEYGYPCDVILSDTFMGKYSRAEHVDCLFEIIACHRCRMDPCVGKNVTFHVVLHLRLSNLSFVD